MFMRVKNADGATLLCVDRVGSYLKTISSISCRSNTAFF